MTLEERVQWLYDRAQISNLLHRFARTLDTKDWEGYIDLYAEDGMLMLPWAIVKRSDMAEAVPASLGLFQATHHISANHAIEISGDTAQSNSYLQAMHVTDAKDQNAQWLAGGWYDNEYRRTDRGWKLTRVKITQVWEIGPRPDMGNQ